MVKRTYDLHRLRVLYLTNIPVPYRVKFFNKLARETDLTVVYESASSVVRNQGWLDSEEIKHRAVFLNKRANTNDNSFNLKSLKYVMNPKYDLIIIGCYNSRCGVLATLILKLLNRDYVINIDGEFFPGRSVKKRIRNWLISGARACLIAGNVTGKELNRFFRADDIFHYHFSSLTADECIKLKSGEEVRSDFVLCVGQYEEYKGIDVLLDVAMRMPQQLFVLVGSGFKSDQLETVISDKGLSNILVIPFLKKAELVWCYKTCAAFVLPSRQECWGLVINEAAACGAPIVSTFGSGAAVDFLYPEYERYLAQPGDATALANALNELMATEIDGGNATYSGFLQNRSASYSIDRMAEEHLTAFSNLAFR